MSALRLKGNPSEVEPGSDPKGETSGPASPQDLLKAKIHREGNSEFSLSLFHYVQQMKYEQGAILPLFDGIAHLEMSLLLELRLLDSNLPVETPQCGDLTPEYVRMIDSRDPLVRIYDVCAQAAKAMNLFDSNAHLFCVDVEYCNRLFRGFNIKILAMVLS
uniref:Uncharacterized protein n=1 Tax=Globisporangium ultimum (strain ATCC 200006 / CBS 805.95 / DAOM BR144) TaxID=431595 RepID=K3W5Z1_GLOUD